jgi:hypothetical protein
VLSYSCERDTHSCIGRTVHDSVKQDWHIYISSAVDSRVLDIALKSGRYARKQLSSLLRPGGTAIIWTDNQTMKFPGVEQKRQPVSGHSVVMRVS